MHGALPSGSAPFAFWHAFKRFALMSENGESDFRFLLERSSWSWTAPFATAR